MPAGFDAVHTYIHTTGTLSKTLYRYSNLFECSVTRDSRLRDTIVYISMNIVSRYDAQCCFRTTYKVCKVQLFCMCSRKHGIAA